MSSSSSANAQDRAYDHVKGRIFALALKPGDWIKAQDIASALQVSRTPVREALSRLEQEGFVRRDGGWGYIVSSVTLRDARELYKVREALEVEAVREAVGQVKAGDLDAMDALLRKADQARARKKVKTFRLNTRAFHGAIARLANNTLLARMLQEIEHKVQLFGAMVFEKHMSRMDEVIEENRAILAALSERNIGEAEAAVRRHVRRAWESYLLYVAEHAGITVETGNLNEQRRRSGQAAIR